MNPRFPWLKNYPEGVPQDVGLAGQDSLLDLIESSFAQFPDRIAIESMGKTISYRKLDVLSQEFAAYLQTLGLETGARVAIMFLMCRNI